MPKNEQTESHKCQGMLSTTWNGICDRKGKLEYQGKWYCATHFPPNKKARSEERQEKYRKEREERKKKTDAIAFERNVKNMVFDRVLRQRPEWVYGFAKFNLEFVEGHDSRIADQMVYQWIELAKKREGLPYEPEA